jgi:hypothetical protein
MPSNNQKTPLVDGLNRFVSAKFTDASELEGKALPASVLAVDPTNTIVTVKFEIQSDLKLPGMIQCPVGLPEWIRYPWPQGTPGFVISSDVYLGGMSGLGGGTATWQQLPNLTNIVWFPCGNTENDPTEDPNKVVIYGPDGVIIRDRGNNGPGYNGSAVQIKVDSAGNVTIWGAKSLTTDVYGYGQKITYEGGTDYTVDIYDQGATVTTNHLPIQQPKIQ